MTKIILIVCVSICALKASSQSTYLSSYYASNGDTAYLTSATGNYNFDTTGKNITWNYATLTGVSQQQLLFRQPSATGFTIAQWPYIYNTNNVNLSSTNQQTITAGSIAETNPNDYFLKNTSLLEEKASSFAIAADSVSLNIKNVYSSPDVLYKFPLNYADTFSSVGVYTTSIPTLYYNNVQISRTDSVNGWGTVITPAGTFSHCLKIISNVTQVDTIAVTGNGIPTITTQYRELKWLDTSKNYPVLYVKETKTGNGYITSVIQYLDVQKYFQPSAQFVYYPLAPSVGDTVTFENLSTNSTSYAWNFNDDSTSVLQNPQHIFKSAGTYNVQLIAYNGSLSDTITEPVKVGGSLPVTLLSFSAVKNSNGNLLKWTTAQETNSSYFAVQRSNDGINFITIGEVNAAGNSSIEKNYSYTDANAASINKPGVYYRLQETDKDGSINFSNIILIKMNIAYGTVSVYPNPAKDVINVTFNNETGNASILLIDMYGKILKQQNQTIHSGGAISINTSNITAGSYFIEAIINGTEYKAHFIKE